MSEGDPRDEKESKIELKIRDVRTSVLNYDLFVRKGASPL